MFFGGLFYLLLKEPHKVHPKKSPKGSLSLLQHDQNNVPSFYDQGIPQELLTIDLAQFSDEKKLQDVLNYRQQKLVYLFQVEMERSGVSPFKDKRRYENLLKKHNLAMEEFQERSQKIMKSFKEKEKEVIQNNKGLR